MASSLPTAPSVSASASSAVKTSANLPHYNNSALSALSFHLPPKPNLRFSIKGQQPVRNSSALVRAQLNEVGVDGSANASASPPIKSEVPSEEAKDVKLPEKPSSAALATEESVSRFMTQVSSLVKLVDSRDIVELHLKQLDCEVVIRKEALSQPVSPVLTMHPPSPSPQPLIEPALPAASPAASIPPSSAPSQSSSPPATKSQKSSLQPLKCPMAGTFYRSPGPGEQPFVKVGDKVQKGQVLCIIEAMKLMNEIEADQSGTIVEIVAEDGKPVSVDTPLFVIEP